jgi:hypothetical protein
VTKAFLTRSTRTGERTDRNDPRPSHTLEFLAVVFGVLVTGIALYSLRQAEPHFSLGKPFRPAFEALSDQIWVSVVGATGILFGAGAILLAAYRGLERGIEQKVTLAIRDTQNLLLTEFSKRQPVHLVDTPDEIWARSIDMLEDLARGLHQNRHAYDVSTYPNRLRYEEAVVKVLDAGITFSRAFCWKGQNSAPNDDAMEWIFKAILSGTVDFTAVESFKEELCGTLRDNQNDPLPAEIDSAYRGRLKAVLEAQHNALRRNLLTITRIPHRMPVDFVAVQYTPTGTNAPHHEVMANFKTSPAADTYVVGTYATGGLAIGYVDLFSHMVHAGVFS